MATENDFRAVCDALERAGVDASGFGVFVNRVVPGVIDESTFDEVAAAPVLREWLPRVTDPGVKQAIVSHLRGAKAVSVDVLIEEYEQADDEALKWELGDAIPRVATRRDFDRIVELAADARHGSARQMLVYSLWRAQTDRAREVLLESLDDPDVALHAGSALRRLLGNEGARPHLAQLVDHPSEHVRYAARENLKRIEKALR